MRKPKKEWMPGKPLLFAKLSAKKVNPNTMTKFTEILKLIMMNLMKESY